MAWKTIDRGQVPGQWQWRDQVVQQVVNTDIDGLLTAASRYCWTEAGNMRGLPALADAILA